jgi:dihydrofolate reductase
MINAILAMDKNYGIGKNGSLPWPRHAEDMKWFYECTKGHVVVMGSTTWNSLGAKKLPGRVNIVCSSRAVAGEPDRVHNVPLSDTLRFLQNLEMEYPNQKIWIIGGSQIYKQMLPFCKTLYMTVFFAEYNCDTFVDYETIGAFEDLLSLKYGDGCAFGIWRRI